MTDTLAPWANLGMFLVIGGVVTLVLVMVASEAEGMPASPLDRRTVPQTLSAIGAVAAFAAGLVAAAVAAVAPGRWWFALLGWAVWIGGEIVVFGLRAAVSAVGRVVMRH